MTLIEGVSPVQMMILREAVCAPRYNLAIMSERLGIAKRGISGQLYRIHKSVEPKLPEASIDQGNGSPLVDLIRAFGFLQFAGRPTPIENSSVDFEADRSSSARSSSGREAFAPSTV